MSKKRQLLRLGMSIMALSMSLGLTSFQERQEKGWSNAEIRNADTAHDYEGLSLHEKDLFLFLNLSRLYPRKFIETYLTSEALRGKSTSERRYARSLVRDLGKLKPCDAFVPNGPMMDLARCFSKEKAKSGRMGHKRKRCKTGYSGECLSYTSYQDPKRHILNLLIDAGIPSLGHRKIMLNPGFNKMGVAIGAHKKYTECAVLDFQ